MTFRGKGPRVSASDAENGSIVDGRRHTIGTANPVASELVLRRRSSRPPPAGDGVLAVSGHSDRGPAVRLPLRPARPLCFRRGRPHLPGRRGVQRREGPIPDARTRTTRSRPGFIDHVLRRGSAIARLTFEDYAAQADTTLSPTAGWGVPVNALEFGLAADAPSSPASIFVTLAATSVGRGWDCVGHRAGSTGTGSHRARQDDRHAAGLRLDADGQLMDWSPPGPSGRRWDWRRPEPG